MDLTTDEWKTRIEPHLASSLQAVSDAITQTEAVQSWLHRASMEAAEGLGQMSGVQGEMQGYMNMMADLEDSLPNLVAAVEEATDGCGQVDLHWRPLQPNFSRLYVSFDRDFTVKVFLRLSECTDGAADTALRTVADALPKGEPFPNRPNTTTGLVAHDGQGLGVRVSEYLREEGSGTTRSVTLLPRDQGPLEQLSRPEAVREMLRNLCSGAG
ncbi:MAG: hypothetical protein ABEL97_13385 [Salinibacter sp.]